jgi:CRISPR-associated protein Csd1
MILQALHEYYLRRAQDPDPTRFLPAQGLEFKPIDFVIELRADGVPISITSLQRTDGKRTVGTPRLVPKGVKKTSGVRANLLWENAEYVFGLADAKKLAEAKASGEERQYWNRLQQKRTAFVQRIEALPEAVKADDGVSAVHAFLTQDPLEKLRGFLDASELEKGNPTLSFRLADSAGELICERPALRGAVSDIGMDESEALDGTPGATETLAANATAATGPRMCLVTGDVGAIATTHAAIKGVAGAQTSGGNIVSYNFGAVESHGWKQGQNAPVGRAAEFQYTTALNALLARGSQQKIRVGDATCVFWAQRPDEPLESELAAILGDSDDPDANTAQVRALLDSVRTGAFAGSRGDNRFFLLGLAPNAARLAVRFWHAAPLREIAERVSAWFDDLAIVRGPADPEYPRLGALLKAVAVMGKADHIPPRLEGELLRSIFEGTSYPVSWLQAAIARCRAERGVPYLRAASIKAALNRWPGDRSRPDASKEIRPMLDEMNPSPAYRLGRLFAALERIQEAANPSLNATICDRYYGAASSTPVAVFATLLRMSTHHLAKIGDSNKGHEVNMKRLVGEIMAGVDGFPAHLDLADQGRFAIGYYHQRERFYVKRASTQSDSKTANSSEGQ